MHLPAETLVDFVCQLFVRLCVPDADARNAARMLVEQEMRGVRTHGLRRIVPNLTGLQRRAINPVPTRRIVSDRDATVVIEGDHGLGMLGAREAMRHAIEKARAF